MAGRPPCAATAVAGRALASGRPVPRGYLRPFSLREDRVDDADPLSLLLPLLRRRPQHHALLEGLARLYRHVGQGRRGALRKALPGLAEEAALWRALRSPERRY